MDKNTIEGPITRHKGYTLHSEYSLWGITHIFENDEHICTVEDHESAVKLIDTNQIRNILFHNKLEDVLNG